MSEQKLQDLFHSISSNEEHSLDDDNIPFLFMGLKTSSFGHSSAFQKSPFLQIKEVAINPNNKWEDRTQAIRYMQKIPHIHREKHCLEAITTIITDNKYPLDDRYYFFSNNEKHIKLDYDIVNYCHSYFFEHFDSFHSPLSFKILSAQYILTQFPWDKFDINKVQNFLISIAKDKDMEINYRAECADILSRAGYNEAINIGNGVIEELGDLYNLNKKNTIYTNLQNVHDTSINNSIIKILRSLISTVTTTRNCNEIYECILSKYSKENNEKEDKQQIITKSLQRIIIDTAKYEGLSMSDILLLVWEKICTSEHKDELQNRLFDELYDMYKTCSSGHMSRIINVLSGFFTDIMPINISYRSQLQSNVFARYTTSMRSLNEYEQEIITDEMTSSDKPSIRDFIFSYSPKKELYEEFVTSKLMSEEDFNEVYLKSENDYFGFEN